MNNIRKRETLQFSISKAKNMNFSPPSLRCNEQICKSRQSLRSMVEKKKKKSWHNFPCFSLMSNAIVSRRIKIEIDRCARQCLNSLKKIRATRRENWKSQFVRFRKGGGERNPGSQLVIIVWKCRIKAVVAPCERVNCYSPLDWFRVYFY